MPTVWRMHTVDWLWLGESTLCLENVGCISVPVCRMQAVYIGSRLENAGCISAPVWRKQAVLQLPSGECRLYISSRLENAGCISALV